MKRSIYVITTDRSPVKVGIASSPLKRLAQLQTGCALRLHLHYSAVVNGNAGILERRVHEIMARSRLSGEWFDADADEAVAAIAEASLLLRIPVIGASAMIPLKGRSDSNRDLVALVDAHDYARLSLHSWYAHRPKAGGWLYARRRAVSGEAAGYILLHQDVMGIVAQAQVYFRNGNGLDCRRTNLRRSTRAAEPKLSADLRREARFDAWVAQELEREGAV